MQYGIAVYGILPEPLVSGFGLVQQHDEETGEYFHSAGESTDKHALLEALGESGVPFTFVVADSGQRKQQQTLNDAFEAADGIIIDFRTAPEDDLPLVVETLDNLLGKASGEVFFEVIDGDEDSTTPLYIGWAGEQGGEES